MAGDFKAFARLAARIATGVLGWTPDAFWGATVLELRLAMEGRAGRLETAAGIEELRRMMEEFPDG